MTSKLSSLLLFILLIALSRELYSHIENDEEWVTIGNAAESKGLKAAAGPITGGYSVGFHSTPLNFTCPSVACNGTIDLNM